MKKEEILKLGRKALNKAICIHFFDWWEERLSPTDNAKIWSPHYHDWTENERSYWNGLVPTDFFESLFNQQLLIKCVEQKAGLFVEISTYNKQVTVFNANCTKTETISFESIEEVPEAICRAVLIVLFS